MKLLVTGAWQCAKEQLNTLRALGHDVFFLQNEKDELPCAYGEVQGIICNGLFLHHPIEKFSSLKFVQLTSAGYDRMPMEYAKKAGIRVYNAENTYSVPMAETALCGVLDLYRKSRFFYENQKAQKWEKNRDLKELFGKKVCVVGCGSVGVECAKRFQAFGCEVVGVTRTKKDREPFDKVFGLNELSNVLPKADIVVVAIALSKETEKLFSKERFAQMKEGSVFVNLARGGLVEETALIQALETKLYGAVLDVFENEPLEESALWKMENVILTPHNSFVGEGNGERLSQVILKNLRTEG
ncbi:MAG: hydroxyacid dehydrogenase [Clostridia bacterium]|nr:hydroxyacid dehydrogenase [Clostridia bacterium]